MANSRSKEIRLWWPLPLAVLIWILLIWGVGFVLSLQEIEPIQPPPPIAASFIDLNEAENAKNSMPASTPNSAQPPQEKANPVVAETKSQHKLPMPAQPPARSQTKPKTVEKPNKPVSTTQWNAYYVQSSRQIADLNRTLRNMEVGVELFADLAKCAYRQI